MKPLRWRAMLRELPAITAISVLLVAVLGYKAACA